MHLLTRLERQKRMLLETRKRDGSWVGTVVSVVVADGHVYFRTYDASGKAKRLRNFAEVRLAPCDLRGRPTGSPATGTARLLSEAEAAPVRALLAEKYPLLQRRLVPAMHRRKGWTTQHYEVELS